MSDLEWLFSPPVSTLVIFAVSFLLSLATTLIRRRFTDPEQAAKWQEEIKTYNENKDRAKKTRDKKLTARLKKQEKRISQMQSKMLKGQLVTMGGSMGLYLVVWQLLIFFYGAASIAYVPFGIPFVTGEPPYPMPIIFWYVICSYLSSTILSRIFGMPTGMGMSPQTTR
jgi:uncharacterized membrane protein (DUF106 family)